MALQGIVSIIIIVITFIISYKGFSDRFFFDRYAFDVEKIRLYKEYKRLATAAFLHVNWMHLIFNMIALFSFGRSLEPFIGSISFVIIYAVSLIGGNLLSLYINRNRSGYSSVGASGAIIGIIFASIVLLPGFSIFFIPGWLFGVIYVLYSIYAIRSGKSNTDTGAHLGGGIIGLLVAIILFPSSLVGNYLPVILVLLPSVIFLYLIIKQPSFLLLDRGFKKNDYYSVDHKYNTEKKNEQEELDRILEKIHKKGIASLTKNEKEHLERLSR